MIECVPNFSEGVNTKAIDAIEGAIASTGALVLHRTSDRDHNRSVITFAGEPDTVLEAAVRAAASAVEWIDLSRQRGVHPRVGALDVLPFAPLEGATLEDCAQLAHRAGARIWQELGVPVYFYEAAALRPERARLESIRQGQFEALRDAALSDPNRRPDLGGPGLHPTAGAVVAGARKLLIAFNLNLATSDLSLAKKIARQIRASNGGFPALKALGLPLESRGLVQVSMNFTDFEQTSLGAVFEAVQELAAAEGVEILESELIGLVPGRALDKTSPESLKLTDFDPGRILENRIAELSRRS